MKYISQLQKKKLKYMNEVLSNAYDEIIQFKCKNTLAIYVLLLLYKNVESKQPHKISTLQNMHFTTENFL